MTDKPNILIAVPAYGDVIRRGCVQSIIKLIIEMNHRGMQFGYTDCDLSDIALVRDVLASYFLQEDRLTHLLFWDSDMVPQPETIFRMLNADKDVVGCVAPKRTLNLNAALNCARAGHSNNNAIAEASDFNLRMDKQRSTENGLVVLDQPEDGIGTGLMLVKKVVFRRLTQTGQIRTIEKHGYATEHGLRGPLYGFFDPIFIGERKLSEDLSFCVRYRRLCAGEIAALPSEDIGHAGSYTYRAKITDRITR